MAEAEESPVEWPWVSMPQNVDVEPATNSCKRPSSESMWST
jgi:hypothetical protein